MSRLRFPRFLALPTLIVCFAALPATADSQRYLILFHEEEVDATDAIQAVEDAGGEVLDGHFEIGVAVVESNSPDFASLVEANRLVDRCHLDSLTPPLTRSFHPQAVDPEVFGDQTPLTAIWDTSATGGLQSQAQRMVTDPTTANGYSLQWNLPLVKAPGAWAQGHLGIPEVTISLVSTGIDYTHLELQGKVDLSRSISFFPDEDMLIEQLFPGIHPVMDLHFEGTHQAGLIACNAINTACVAPNATLIGVKAINKDFQTSVGRIITGILYSTHVGAQVISLTERRLLDLRNFRDRILVRALRRAINYAYRNGSVVITEAGIGILDPDLGSEVGINADEDPFYIRISPQQTAHRIMVASSVGPELETLRFFNYGRSLVDVAAPGGREAPGITDVVLSTCSSFSQLVANCFRDDPSDPYQYVTSFGPTPASAHLAGLAALLYSSKGGHANPNWVRAKILTTADDIGDPGFDAFFGRGLINVSRALDR